MRLLFDFSVAGLVVGCIYALLAVGFGLIYQTSGVFHLAHAGVMAVGGYLGYTAATLVFENFFWALLVATCVAALFGLLMYQGVYQFLIRQGGSLIVTFIGALGMLLVTQAILGIAYGMAPIRLPFSSLGVKHSIGGVGVSTLDWIIVGTSVILVGGVGLFMGQTAFGRCIRAVGSDPSLARAYGLPIRRAIVVVFLLSSALAGSAGVFVASQSFLTPGFGLDKVLVASIAVFLGGVGSVWGAAFAALLIGWFQSVSLLWVSGTWQNSITFGVFLALVLVFPRGFVGGREVLDSLRRKIRRRRQEEDESPAEEDVVTV